MVFPHLMLWRLPSLFDVWVRCLPSHEKSGVPWCFSDLLKYFQAAWDIRVGIFFKNVGTLSDAACHCILIRNIDRHSKLHFSFWQACGCGCRRPNMQVLPWHCQTKSRVMELWNMACIFHEPRIGVMNIGVVRLCRVKISIFEWYSIRITCLYRTSGNNGLLIWVSADNGQEKIALHMGRAGVWQQINY